MHPALVVSLLFLAGPPGEAPPAPGDEPPPLGAPDPSDPPDRRDPPEKKPPPRRAPLPRPDVRTEVWDGAADMWMWSFLGGGTLLCCGGLAFDGLSPTSHNHEFDLGDAVGPTSYVVSSSLVLVAFLFNPFAGQGRRAEAPAPLPDVRLALPSAPAVPALEGPASTSRR